MSEGGDNERGTELLRDCVRQAVEHYFRRPDGHDAPGLFKLVMAEIEPPLCESVLTHAGENRSRAANMLGINRGTLRKKTQPDGSRRYRLICGGKPLHDCVRKTVADYLRHLDGHDVSGFFDLVMGEVEPPLLESVLSYAGGNQGRAAALLGINGATLRKKLERYRLKAGVPRRLTSRGTPARALISVSDKTGIVEFARALRGLGIEILSTGGTAQRLGGAGVPVVEIASYTGFPEMMDGRVKTLHPKVHGGLLARRDTDARTMREHGIKGIDLLVANLYPFERTVADPGCDPAAAVENIDVGGPAMLRAAAKNHAWVTAVVDAGDYATVLEELRATGRVAPDTRLRLAAKAFEHTARYDGAIARYLAERAGTRAPAAAFPSILDLRYVKSQEMRYGENPHQRAAFYVEQADAGAGVGAAVKTGVGANPGTGAEASVATATQRQGKALSFNNVADTDAALECVKSFSEPACVIVKHANPCGAAIGEGIREAYERAFRTDPTSAFGGIIAFNRPLDAETAAAIVERQFVEVVIAPRLEPEALAPLADKPNVRVLECGALPVAPRAALDFKCVAGGLLVQDRDTGAVAREDLEVVTRRAPTGAEMRDLLFAWKVVKFVKSNAIVYCRDGMTIGIGAGQMSRIHSARIAAVKAADEELEVRGSVLASDAFFPFRDGIDAAAEVGVGAVIEPGGSIRDDEVIAAADEHGMAMVFTRMRHFRH